MADLRMEFPLKGVREKTTKRKLGRHFAADRRYLLVEIAVRPAGETAMVAVRIDGAPFMR